MNKKYKYEYFISYSCEKEGTPLNGFGHCFIDRERKIKTMEDVQSIIELIKEDQGFENVVILNYKRLGKE